MRKQRWGWVITLLCCAILPGTPKPEKILLQLKPKSGERSQVRLTVTHYLQPKQGGATPPPFVTTIVISQRVQKVAADGTLTGEQTITSYEASIGGRKLPVPEDYLQDQVIVTVKPTGELVRRERRASDQNRSHPEQRHLGQSIVVIFSRKPVGVGEKWEYTLREDPATMAVPARYEYTLRRLERWKGRRVARVQIQYTALGQSRARARGEALIDIETGRVLYARARVEGLNLPFSENAVINAADVLLERLL